MPATRRNSPFARGSHSTAPRPPRIRPHMRATNTPRQTHFARNFQRSFFKHARKRCNPNDQRSQFEVPSRELRAKFPETARPDTTASLPAIGGNCTIRGTTRRRHADSQLLMLQNPPPTPSRQHVTLHIPRARWNARRSSPVEWCNRFVSFGLGYALSWSGGSSCPVGWGVSRDLVRMSRLR